MQKWAGNTCLGSGCGGRRVLIRSEKDDLTRLAGLVRRSFDLPVAYCAMLGHHDQVMCRIGSGRDYWNNLKTLPLSEALKAPFLIRDAERAALQGADLGELQFVAAAPIDTFCGQHFGILVVADIMARPDFSEQSLENLVEMAGVIGAYLELRMIATQATESMARYEEAEERFTALANCAGELIACNGADGTCEFVNEEWSRFTGSQDLSQHSLDYKHLANILNLSVQGKPFRIELPLCRHDGVFRLMRGRGEPRVLKDGSFAGFVLSLTDIGDYAGGPVSEPE